MCASPRDESMINFYLQKSTAETDEDALDKRRKRVIFYNRW